MERVVLISGASSGIGRASADRLQRAGWTVVGASRRGTSSGGWTPMAMDVDRDDSVADGVAAVLGDHGRLDAVVACAGWGLAGPVEQTPIAEAKAQIETNFWGAVRLVQAALPAMRARGTGRLVLISSIVGVIGVPFQAFYTASKFAMEGYAEALAYEVAPFGIDVSLVQPGNVRTDFTASRRDVQAPEGDPYGAVASKAISKMARDEANGVGPEAAAAVIQRVLESARPPRRASVGKFDERIGLMAKRLMPYRLFEKAAKGSLGV
jgi:NAD(P)-dependent dehydrogenase (short-subunit alcohol dehydrogenase family)